MWTTTSPTIHPSLHSQRPPLIDPLSLIQRLVFFAQVFLSSTLEGYSSAVPRTTYFLPNVYGLRITPPHAAPFLPRLNVHHGTQRALRPNPSYLRTVELAPGSPAMVAIPPGLLKMDPEGRQLGKMNTSRL